MQLIVLDIFSPEEENLSVKLMCDPSSPPPPNKKNTQVYLTFLQVDVHLQYESSTKYETSEKTHKQHGSDRPWLFNYSTTYTDLLTETVVNVIIIYFP